MLQELMSGKEMSIIIKNYPLSVISKTIQKRTGIFRVLHKLNSYHLWVMQIPLKANQYFVIAGNITVFVPNLEYSANMR